jgi:ActR/RegA family two-component response regulator
MGKATRVALVGHCGADSMMLRGAISRADGKVRIDAINDQASAIAAAGKGDTVLLVNRVLDGSFTAGSGVDLIRELHDANPAVRAMLISNYPDAQADAEAVGALPGFGKSAAHTDATTALLRDAIAGR